MMLLDFKRRLKWQIIALYDQEVKYLSKWMLLQIIFEIRNNEIQIHFYEVSLSSMISNANDLMTLWTLDELINVRFSWSRRHFSTITMNPNVISQMKQKLKMIVHFNISSKHPMRGRISEHFLR